jgi:hypothetical protein
MNIADFLRPVFSLRRFPADLAGDEGPGGGAREGAVSMAGVIAQVPLN